MSDELTGTLDDYRVGGPMDRNVPAFNPGWTAAEYEEGLRYVAPWEDPFSGFPEHARRCARALADTGIPVQLRSINAAKQIEHGYATYGSETHKVMDQCSDLLSCTIQKCLVEITQTVISDVALHNMVLTHRFLDPRELDFINKYRILSTVFERDRISENATRCLGKLGQVWVANPTDVQMLVRCGLDEQRVKVVPIPHFPDDPLLSCKKPNRFAGAVRFYHIGKWEPRKAQHEMLGAFLRAFEPGEAKLYLKTSPRAPNVAPYPNSPDESLRYWHKKYPGDPKMSAKRMAGDVFVITKMIPAKQILHLHSVCDVYVSLSRGEGFDMPAYDAKLAGNRMLYTPTGGPSSFAATDDFLVPSCGSIPCHPWYGWNDAEYLGWDEDAAVAAFREAKRSFDADRTRAEHDLMHMTAKEVGKKMRQYVQELL